MKTCLTVIFLNYIIFIGFREKLFMNNVFRTHTHALFTKTNLKPHFHCINIIYFLI